MPCKQSGVGANVGVAKGVLVGPSRGDDVCGVDTDGFLVGVGPTAGGSDGILFGAMVDEEVTLILRGSNLCNTFGANLLWTMQAVKKKKSPVSSPVTVALVLRVASLLLVGKFWTRVSTFLQSNASFEVDQRT